MNKIDIIPLDLDSEMTENKASHASYHKIEVLPYEETQKQLEELLMAEYPLIFLRTSEEIRAVLCVVDAYLNLTQSEPDIQVGKLVRWNSTEGFEERLISTNASSKIQWRRIGSPPEPSQEPIIQAIETLKNGLEEASKNPDCQYTYLLPDWSSFIKPDCDLSARKIKELVIATEQKRPRPRMSLVVIGSDWSIPTILRNHVHIVDLRLPIGKELYQKVFKLAVTKYNLKEDSAKHLAEQAQGMTSQAVAQTAKLITRRGLWEQPEEASKLLLEVKKQEIEKTGILDYYEPKGDGLQEVGGLENIKTWIQERYPWFEQDSDPDMRPRAILLEGFPGCGKSFIARAIAIEWRVPQINFEISRLQSKWVGESESNTYQALRAIEASAPNILFMDEIEKAFAGVGGDSSGTTTRQFGTFLTWLNDHKEPIFFIATSNNRSVLPPEMFRAGRFDETFIVMPPTTEERREIIRKRVKARKLSPISNSLLEFLIDNTLGFSGAELDKLVKETKISTGLNQEPTEYYWKEALRKINPQYKTKEMQALLKSYINLVNQGNVRSASKGEEGFLERLLLS